MSASLPSIVLYQVDARQRLPKEYLTCILSLLMQGDATYAIP